MGATYFQDFTRDNGLLITVEYSARGGEPHHDHPGHICDGGGSGPDICILSSWPNTKAFDITFERQDELIRSAWPLWRWPFNWLELHAVNLIIWGYERSARLTDAEREWMEEWLIEHYVEEPYEEDYL